ncbi:MAG: PIG-L deacetylase family protein [Nitrososphaeraceae archaeon]|jgi:LmbE family N-acetylglucosaminyl deacetylase
MSKNQSVIAFGAHPDDLEIGMGGTLAKLARMDYDVNMVIATLPNFVKTDTKEQRRMEATMSAKTLGCKSPQFLDLPPDAITIGRKFVNIIDEIIHKHEQATVFTQWIGDSHQDHQALTRAVIAASRDCNNLLMYETTIPGGLTESAFRPQLYIDITETLKMKSNALECFHSQKNNRCGNFWIDAVVGRCSYRGYQMNVKYAEAFEVIKVTKW